MEELKGLTKVPQARGWHHSPGKSAAETFHDEGKTDMYQAMKTCFEMGFNGPMREDHVPTVAGDSNEHPGYSELGTRFAIGYIKGLMEAAGKES